MANKIDGSKLEFSNKRKTPICLIIEPWMECYYIQPEQHVDVITKVPSTTNQFGIMVWDDGDIQCYCENPVKVECNGVMLTPKYE